MSYSVYGGPMGEAVIIRAPSIDDAEAIARVHTDMWRTTYMGVVPGVYLDDDAMARRHAQWSRVLGVADREQNVAVAVHDSTIIGCAHCGTEGDLRKLFSLYVRDAFHGTGVAQRLLDTVVDTRPTELWVAQDNLRARAFYTRNGFAPDGSAEDFPGIPGLVVIKLTRPAPVELMTVTVGDSAD